MAYVSADNTIIIHGHLGAKPDLQERQGTKGPYKTASFSVAVDRNDGDTDWFRCGVIGKQAETVEKFLDKGSEVIVLGSMRSYKPKNNPDTKAWVVDVHSVRFCGSKGSNSGTGARPADPDVAFEPTDEDIPF